MSARILTGDCRASLATLPDASVRCCVTSPPYWGLRDYGVAGQLGLERTPEEYVAAMVAVFREVRRVLKDDGVLWLNLGDSYAQSGGPGWQGKNGQRADRRFTAVRDTVPMRGVERNAPNGLKPKDLVGIPWRVAFALQADGWWLRSDCIWAKPNPMPESVTDRPTKAHEYVFLLSKSSRYFYNRDAVAERVKVGARGSSFIDERDLAVRPTTGRAPRGKWSGEAPQSSGRKITENVARARAAGGDRDSPFGETRNLQSVWTIATTPFSGAHFATFPVELAERCIKSGSREGDTVLDPFGGAGTVGLVADRLGRDAILCELNPAYAEMARRRIEGDAPLLAEVRS